MIEQQVFYEWVPMLCQICHKVGHICKENKKENGMQTLKQEWKIKDNGKQVVDTVPEVETWVKPKKVATPTIQVGNLQVLTGNGYKDLDVVDIEGGDLFPFLDQ